MGISNTAKWSTTEEKEREWERIQEQMKAHGPTESPLPPSNVIKLYVENIESAVKDLKRILKQYEAGEHLRALTGEDIAEPKVLTSKNFYHD
jgi:hypothetical protein